MTADLIHVTPYQGNDGTTGQCARWTGEPTAEQAARFASNEWAVGATHAPENWQASDTGTGRGERTPGAVGWGVALFVGIVLLLAALVVPAFGIAGIK